MGMFGFDDQYTMYDTTPLDNHFILEYLPAAKGDHVKVYLYGLMLCYHPQENMTMERMARELGMTEGEVMAAFRYWERYRLVQRISDQPPAFRYVNTKQRLATGSEVPEDDEYARFGEALHELFDNERRLHGSEVTMCYDWVENMHLPPEVVLRIIKHMIAIRGKQCSIKSAEKLAIELAELKITTVEDADAFLTREKQVWDGTRKVLRRLGKRREPSEDEMSLYKKWLKEWGYAPDAIEAACAETTKGEPTFAYLDGILRGLMQRSGKAAASRQEVEQARSQDQARIAPLKAILATLKDRSVSINEGTLTIYDEMLRLYPDEIIQRAALWCAQYGRKYNDMIAVLDNWKRSGYNTLEEIETSIRRVDEQNLFLGQLYEKTGASAKPNSADRALLQKWQEEYGFTRELIAFCAQFAVGVEKPMPYLDSMLDAFSKQGVRTEEDAMAARKAWQEKHQAKLTVFRPRSGKVLREQQYEQRTYENSTGMPDWMKARLEAMKDDDDA